MFTTVIGSYPFNYQDVGREAITMAVRDQLDAGIYLVSDGQTRYGMVDYFARSIEGYSLDNGSEITGKIGRGEAAELTEDLEIVRGMTSHFKGIITGPVTLVFSSKIRSYYEGYSDERVYLDTARALLDIARMLQASGAEWIQIDEPYLSVGAPMDIAQQAIESIAVNLDVPVALHVCGTVKPIFKKLLQWKGITMLSHAFMGDDNLEILSWKELKDSNKILGLGCIDTTNTAIEETGTIENVIRTALENLPEERLIIHPDCGLKLFPRDIAFKKLKQMTAATENVSQSRNSAGNSTT